MNGLRQDERLIVVITPAGGTVEMVAPARDAHAALAAVVADAPHLILTGTVYGPAGVEHTYPKEQS